MKDDICKDWRVVRNSEGTGCLFYCAGCDMQHAVYQNQPGYPSWTFNGDMKRPTFEPSILVTWDQMSADGRARCALFHAEHGRHADINEIPYDMHKVCHSFVRDGMIQYLSDCTHRLAGNTLPLLDYEHWFNQDA